MNGMYCSVLNSRELSLYMTFCRPPGPSNSYEKSLENLSLTFDHRSKKTSSPLSTFLQWTPASLGCEGTDPSQITMDKKKSVKAVFRGPNKLKVVATFKIEATGTVTSGDTLINCPGTCEQPYVLNAPVTLTAGSGPGSTFVM